MSTVHLKLGYLYFNLGAPEVSAIHYHHYLELQNKLNNYAGIISAVINLAAIKVQMQQFEEANKAFLMH